MTSCKRTYWLLLLGLIPSACTRMSAGTVTLIQKCSIKRLFWKLFQQLHKQNAWTLCKEKALYVTKNMCIHSHYIGLYTYITHRRFIPSLTLWQSRLSLRTSACNTHAFTQLIEHVVYSELHKYYPHNFQRIFRHQNSLESRHNLQSQIANTLKPLCPISTVLTNYILHKIQFWWVSCFNVGLKSHPTTTQISQRSI